MPVLNRAPRPDEFARAWVDTYGAALREAAGKDGRISRTEASRIAERLDGGQRASDNVVNWLEAAGQKSVSVEKFLDVARGYVERMAARAAGADGRVSLVDAQSLPADLQQDFLALRGRVVDTPPALEGDALKAAVASQVLAALDADSATKLSRPPSVVRGRRPYIENLPHPASNTRAIVYVANRTVYLSRASSAPSPLVGWYRVGPLPV